MVLLQNFMLCVCALAVAVNGQTTPLGIYPNMTITATPGADSVLIMTMVNDLETQGTPSTCGATTAAASGAIAINMLQAYMVSSVMILNKATVTQAAVGGGAAPAALTITNLNGASAAVGTTVAVSTTPTGGTQCTPVAPSTVSTPFVASGSNIAANYACGNTTGQYLIFMAPAASTTGIFICQLTVYQQDQPATTTTTTAAPTTTKKRARFVHMDWSIIIAMLLAVITKLMIDNGRQ